MEKINIPMSYNYKGSINCNLRLEHDPRWDTILLITDYGERIATVTSGHGLIEVLNDLVNNKYA